MAEKGDIIATKKEIEKIRKAYYDAESAFNKAYKAYTDALKKG